MTTVYKQLTPNDKQYLTTCIKDKRMTMQQTMSASHNFFGKRLTLTIGALRRVIREANIEISSNRVDYQKLNFDAVRMESVGWVMAIARRKFKFSYHYMHNLARHTDNTLVKDQRGGTNAAAMLTSANCSEFLYQWSTSVLAGDSRKALYKWVSATFMIDIVSCPAKVSTLLKRIRAGRNKNRINGRFVEQGTNTYPPRGTSYATDSTPDVLVAAYEDEDTPFTWLYLSLKFPCYTRQEMHTILGMRSDRYADKLGGTEPPLIDDTDLVILHAHFITFHGFIDICYLLRIYDISDNAENSDQYLSLKMYSIEKGKNLPITDIPEYHNI